MFNAEKKYMDGDNFNPFKTLLCAQFIFKRSYGLLHSLYKDETHSPYSMQILNIILFKQPLGGTRSLSKKKNDLS